MNKEQLLTFLETIEDHLKRKSEFKTMSSIEASIEVF